MKKKISIWWPFILVFLVCLLTSSCKDPVSEKMASSTNPNKIFRWKMITTWPANFPIFQEGAIKFADDIRKMSNGRMDISVYAGDELVPPLQVFDAVSQGTVEIGHGAAYYWAGKIPEAQFFSTVPFGMTARGMHAWLYSGGGLALWQEIYEPFGLTVFPMGNTGVQMGGWFNKKIHSLEDIKGLRMRIPGLGGKVLKAAGGNPVLMAGSEIYTALERGTIDATEWVGPFHDLRLGLDRAAKYYYTPGWHEPGTEFELIINRQRFDELPDDLKKIMEVAAAATGVWIYAQMESHNQEALQILKDKTNVEILVFPEDVLMALKTLTAQTLQQEAEKNPKFAKVYQAYRQFREDYNNWDEMANINYQKANIR